MPTDLQPLLRVESLSIRYEQDGLPTPQRASFDIAPGTVTLLLGPSGSGKSSLSLAACGLIPQVIPAQLDGRVLVDGRDTTQHRVAELSTGIGMVFQDPDAQIIMGTLLDEVCFGPENLLLPVDDVLSRAEQALRAVGLWGRRHESPDRLSGGGKQRLAIACVFALRSPVIVLDEPTANLDPVGVADVYATLADIVADGAHALLLIEHNLDACVDLVDQVVVLDHRGRPVMTGTVDEVLRARSDELEALGIWLPVATRAARQLRHGGVTLAPLPTTPAELARALDAHPCLPALPETSAPPAPPNRGTAVRISGLTVMRGERTILDRIELTVGSGDFLAILGVNGAGKSTLLHAIAGVVPPAPGVVEIDGLDPATAPIRELSRRIGFVFQNPEHQFVCETVAEELAHTLRVHGVPDEEARVRGAAMLTRLELTAERDRHPFLLSGGQKRRLSVGSALIGGASVLVLDEPTYGQDRDRAAELLRFLRELRADGTTVIVATHDIQLVADHATHAAVLAGGTITAHDSTQTLFAGDACERAGLLPPPLVAAMRSLTRHAGWRGVTRLADLPGGST
ncbi:ABC transporter ATP-binding protein [Leucobacter sp. M11]|uniref:ABC transporter ATP-binding protein n=1 Tax=Leucobacter sp. M11 TaxID=2993565 RepID=UPI002D7F0A97|nr:energy-coupling factor transporter ATPase [Leucobacter sp. M11]MEB4613391.1 energy-coupling factor transporter ATPase [Leucobacter sp. M11]